MKSSFWPASLSSTPSEDVTIDDDHDEVIMVDDDINKMDDNISECNVDDREEAATPSVHFVNPIDLVAESQSIKNESDAKQGNTITLR